MSMIEFQRVYANLVTKPGFVDAVLADPHRALTGYDLSPREQRRVLSVAGQRGMLINRILYRANRMSPLYLYLPLTFRVLDRHLRRELDRFWQYHDLASLQFYAEVSNFAAFLKARVAEGAIDSPFLEEVLDYEIALRDLRFLPRRRPQQEATARPATDSASTDSMGTAFALPPLLRVVAFRHDPDILLPRLEQAGPLPDDLPEGEHYRLLDARRGDVRVHRIGIDLGRRLAASYALACS